MAKGITVTQKSIDSVSITSDQYDRLLPRRVVIAWDDDTGALSAQFTPRYMLAGEEVKAVTEDVSGSSAVAAFETAFLAELATKLSGTSEDK